MAASVRNVFLWAKAISMTCNLHSLLAFMNTHIHYDIQQITISIKESFQEEQSLRVFIAHIVWFNRNKSTVQQINQCKIMHKINSYGWKLYLMLTVETSVSSGRHAHSVSPIEVMVQGFLHGVPSGPKRMCIGDFPSNGVFLCIICIWKRYHQITYWKQVQQL